MPAGRVTDTHVIVAAGILTVLLGGAAAFIEPPAGSGVDRPSSFSASAGGGKAAFLTLARLGYDIARSYEPMTAIDVDPTRTTIILTGTVRPSEQDRRALQTFLEQGGTAVLVGVQGADFLRVAGTAPPDPLARPSRHRVVTPSPLARNAAEITMVPAESPPRFGPSYVRVFTVRGDQPLVATARVGRGHAIWLASGTPLANAHIPDADNLQLLLNAVGPGERKVLWDEHYHGHSRSLWSYAATTPLPWIGAQLGVMAIAVFAGYSRRSGPVRPRAVDARTSPLEFIDMLRALYQRAGASTAAVTVVRSRLQRVVASTCGIPIDSPGAVFAKAIAAKSGLKTDEVLETLAASARAERDPDLKAAEALRLTQQLQHLTSTVRGPRSAVRIGHSAFRSD